MAAGTCSDLPREIISSVETLKTTPAPISGGEIIISVTALWIPPAAIPRGSPRGVNTRSRRPITIVDHTPRGEPVARLYDAIPFFTSLEGLDVLLYFGQQALAGLEGGPGTVGGDEEVIQFMRCPYERVIL